MWWGWARSVIDGGSENGVRSWCVCDVVLELISVALVVYYLNTVRITALMSVSQMLRGMEKRIAYLDSGISGHDRTVIWSMDRKDMVVRWRERDVTLSVHFCVDVHGCLFITFVQQRCRFFVQLPQGYKIESDEQTWTLKIVGDIKHPHDVREITDSWIQIHGTWVCCSRVKDCFYWEIPSARHGYVLDPRYRLMNITYPFVVP